MFKITLKNIIRSFYKHLNISLISLFSLVLAFTVFIFIGHYVLYEKSFDSFWTGNDNIYRVATLETHKGLTDYDGVKTPRGIFYAKDEIPEAEYCAYSFFESCQVKKEPHALFEQKVLWISDDFQKIFDFKMKYGEANFEKTHTGIISEKKANILFGNENPIGKIIKVNEGMPIEITGVFKDLPTNTHLEADYFISVRTWVDYGWIPAQGGWRGNSWWTYFKLKPNVNPIVVEQKLAGLIKVHRPELSKQERTVEYHLQALKDIHFDPSKKGDLGKKIRKSSIINLLIFGIFVLIVAWINYLNLSTALAIRKEKSIGIQKLVGAGYKQQIVHVVMDNLLFNLLAVLITWILHSILSPFMSDFFSIPIDKAFIPKQYILLGFTSIVAIGVIISSLYSVLTVLKINPFVHKTTLKQGVFQRSLIIAQLCITILFISISTLIYRQINFMQQYDLGMNMEKVLILSAPTSYNGQVNPQRLDNPKFDRFRNFRDHLLNNPSIISVTSTSDLAGVEMMGNSVPYTRPNVEVDINERFGRIEVDYDYIKTFNLDLLAGKESPDTKNRYYQLAYINESAVKALGFTSAQEAIGQTINRYKQQFTICGVVKDFNFEGLHKKIYPMVLEFAHTTEFGYYPVKVNTGNISATMKLIKENWEKYYPNDPFNCFFQDEFYNQQYQADVRIARFNILFAILSVFISCLGLYGVIMFYITRKRKEIGIRKVNGAPVLNIMYRLNRNIIIWLSIALCISIPVGIYLMHLWLNNFAYKTEVSWWIFGMPGLIAMTIALITVSWQSWKAATRNPVEALRYE